MKKSSSTVRRFESAEKVVQEITGVLREYERYSISERIKAGMKARKERLDLINMNQSLLNSGVSKGLTECNLNLSGKIKNGVIYCRVANETAGENNAIANQEKTCRDLAAEEGIQVCKVFRECQSGISIDRPGINELVRYCKDPDNQITHLLITDLNRLSRSYTNLSFIMSIFGNLEIRVLFAK